MAENQTPNQHTGDIAHEVTVLYRAFEDTPVAVSFSYSTDGDVDHPALCELLFEQTNTYRGTLFALMEPGLEATRDTGRHHTALSVGDQVAIDGRTWECAPLGWEPRPPAWEHVLPRTPTPTPKPPKAPAPDRGIQP
jgi:hypothetical protein